MSIAALVKTLLDAGVDADTIVSAVAAVEVDAVDARSKAALRTQRWRDRKASQNVTGDACDGRDVDVPSLSKNPTPIDPEYREGRKEEREPQPSKPAKPKPHDLPSDWSPSETDRAKAEKIGLPQADIDREAEKFANHFHNRAGTKAGRMLNWSLAWQNWCHRAVEWHARSKPTPTVKTFVTSGKPNDIASAFDELRSDMRSIREGSRGGDRDDYPGAGLQAAAG